MCFVGKPWTFNLFGYDASPKPHKTPYFARKVKSYAHSPPVFTAPRPCSVQANYAAARRIVRILQTQKSVFLCLRGMGCAAAVAKPGREQDRDIRWFAKCLSQCSMYSCVEMMYTKFSRINQGRCGNIYPGPGSGRFRTSRELCQSK